ncbi:MAG: cbb3-type cytochrome oxidase assembly protein [Phycisphaerae bacterium]
MKRPGPTRWKRVVVVVALVGIMAPGGYGFVEKFIQFVRTLNSDAGGGFTIIPITNYLIIAMGFLCLLAWAVANGMFRDVEGPKYTMLDREAEIDRRDGRPWSDKP